MHPLPVPGAVENAIAYLDHNATAPLVPPARLAMLSALDGPANPSSVHRFGRSAWRLVDQARRQVADLAGVPPTWVVFTSGATEANATVCGALPDALISAIEHDSVRTGHMGATLPVTADGEVDLAALDAELARMPAGTRVSVMAVNNETGVIQPIEEIAAIARRHGARLHCDAVQAAGRIPMGPITAVADYVTVSAHKVGGPPGVGALIVAEGAPFSPLLRGGGQEQRRRAGTENVPGIVGFGAACEAAQTGLATYGRLAALRDGLESRLSAACPQLTVFGGRARRVANTSCLAMPGVAAETQVMAFDLAGVAVSAGAACSSGKVTRSHVLDAMGAGVQADWAVRISLGPTTRADEVDRFAAAWERLYQRKRSRAAA